MALMFWGVSEVAAEPCAWKKSFFDPGPSVSDLANALTTIPGRNASDPVPISVDGFPGLYLEWNVPTDPDVSVCDNEQFVSWLGSAGASIRSHKDSGQIDRLWIVDVDGTRVVFDGPVDPATPAEDLSQMDELVASIRFLPE